MRKRLRKKLLKAQLAWFQGTRPSYWMTAPIWVLDTFEALLMEWVALKRPRTRPVMYVYDEMGDMDTDKLRDFMAIREQMEPVWPGRAGSSADLP